MTVLDHGGLMDRVYRRQRHFYDATRKYYLLGRDPMIAGLKPPPGAAVLEIGCGTGRKKTQHAPPRGRIVHAVVHVKGRPGFGMPPRRPVRRPAPAGRTRHRRANPR